MYLTSPLRPPPPRYPLDIHPIARLRPNGRLDLLQAAFPPLGPVMLATWHPGEEPGFRLVTGRIERGWRWIGPTLDAYVVAWQAFSPEPQRSKAKTDRSGSEDPAQPL